FILGGLASMGMPPFSGFIAEFPIFVGVWEGIPKEIIALAPTALTKNGAHYYVYIVALSAISIILTATYVLRVTAQVFFGKFDEEKYPEVLTKPLRIQDRAAIFILAIWLVVLGLHPTLLSDKIESAVEPVVGL